VYCIWVFVGMHREDLLWAVALAALGIPFHLWAMRARRQNPSSNEEDKSTVTI